MCKYSLLLRCLGKLMDSLLCSSLHCSSECLAPREPEALGLYPKNHSMKFHLCGCLYKIMNEWKHVHEYWYCSQNRNCQIMQSNEFRSVDSVFFSHWCLMRIVGQQWKCCSWARRVGLCVDSVNCKKLICSGAAEGSAVRSWCLWITWSCTLAS